MAWIVHTFGWHHVFTVMGALGIAFAVVWVKTIYGPKDHPSVNRAERDYIEAGGALVDMDGGSLNATSHAGRTIKQLLSNRMLVGIYIAQYCITVLTYFFLTWFPVYLVKERGFSMSEMAYIGALAL